MAQDKSLGAAPTEVDPQQEKSQQKSGQRKYKSYKQRREEAAEKARAKREAGVPDPWFARKAAVGLAAILIAYGSVAFIGWVCVPMIRLDPHKRGSRTRGICLLVFFILLLLMVIWSYLRVLFTSPGIAKEHCPQVECPQLEPTPFQPAEEHPHSFAENPASSEHPLKGAHPTAPPQPQWQLQPRPAPPNGMWAPQQPHQGEEVEKTKKGRVVPRRAPHRTPVLQSYFRWCSRCQVVKPYRAHHCRHCGTCVLKMDHHCPWIGGCVGARNYKFFLVFCFWAALYCLYIFGGTITALIPIYNPPDIDYYLEPQQIVVLIIAVVFGLFTIGMVGSHLRLTLLNLTTIEEIGVERVESKEAADLDHAFGALEVRQKAKTRKRWRQEWGTLRKEGNPWWLGSAGANWRMVFGDNVWAWLLPIKASPQHDEGLEYELNPRFTKDGIQLPRTSWPKELQ